MKVIERDISHDVLKVCETDVMRHALRELSPQEIKAVAGGPEGEVGSGQSPPY